MQVETMLWLQDTGWNRKATLTNAQLVLYFAGRAVLEEADCYGELKTFYPMAHILGCSTGGEIFGEDVLDDSISVAAVCFSHATLRTAVAVIDNAADSFRVGKNIAEQLNASGLRYIFLLSDGTNVNGSDLVRGIFTILDSSVVVTGGLAGDGANFKYTEVGLDEIPKYKRVAAIGLYGAELNVTYGSVGGWAPFGPHRKITKSKDNVLYELDGKPALDLYKQYLGDDAKNLPSSGLMFPLSIRSHIESNNEIVRTIMAIDEDEKALIFAGDIPQGATAQLMRGDSNHLVDGATMAASLAVKKQKTNNSLAILVSCIGRKLLMGQSISDETEAIADVFEHKIPTIGFYSYGEICHQELTGECNLHNQTMTVTVLHENG